MAASCIDEAIRQIIAVGGSLERIALLDNFCWGNPDKPDRLGSLVRCAQGCYKAAVAFGTPFISGKDSLYNEYTQKGKSLAIPGTILISAIGIIDDVGRCVTMDFKNAGNSIYVIGTTFDELGGSIYLENLGQLGLHAPQVNFKTAVKTYRAVEKAIRHVKKVQKEKENTHDQSLFMAKDGKCNNRKHERPKQIREILPAKIVVTEQMMIKPIPIAQYTNGASSFLRRYKIVARKIQKATQSAVTTA